LWQVNLKFYNNKLDIHYVKLYQKIPFSELQE